MSSSARLGSGGKARRHRLEAGLLSSADRMRVAAGHLDSEVGGRWFRDGLRDAGALKPQSRYQDVRDFGTAVTTRRALSMLPRKAGANTGALVEERLKKNKEGRYVEMMLPAAYYSTQANATA